MSLVAIVSLVFCVQLPPPHPSPARGEGDIEVNQSGDCLVDIRRQLNTNRGTA
jgi:hypothetical protein